MSRLIGVTDSIFSVFKPRAADPADPLPTPEQRLSLPGSAPAAAVSAGQAGAVDSMPATPPAAAAKPARQLTKQLLVEEARRANCNRTRDILRIGRLASLWCDGQKDRAAAIREIRDAYEEGGLRGDLLNVNRQIRSYWLHELLAPQVVKSLGVSTVYALLPLVKRDSRTDVWTLRPGLESRAHELIARLGDEHWGIERVNQEVAALFPPRKAAHKKIAARRVGKIQQQIKRLAPAEIAELRDWLDSLSRAAAA